MSDVKVGSPARTYGWRKVCVIWRIEILWGQRRYFCRCSSVEMLSPRFGRAATHRRDGTPYPVCEVCAEAAKVSP